MPAPGLNDGARLVASHIDLAAETVVQSSIHLALEQMIEGVGAHVVGELD
ncbi:MAG: hypothetical protein JOZ29_08575 [Deltaproteobacteria bacterium]|nr:hypothetical protein [Deltaproteobacteria bacterium]